MSGAILRRLPGATVAFSTREGGVSSAPYDSLNLGILTEDDPGRVRRNRDLLVDGLGLDRAAVATGMQVHGAALAAWNAPPKPAATLQEVDGHVTDAEGLGLLVLAADCLPVALAGPGRVAMLHCGWRGVEAGILAAGVARFDEPPAAVVGPGIGQCCFEVGPEVLEAFSDVPAATAGRMLDLRAVVEARLRAAGVTAIEHVDLCTCCREDLFFSHRRDGGITGRQGGLVWRS